MNTATAMTPLEGTNLDIPLAQLHDSPFQPRKTYNQAKLQELAETMRPPNGRVLQRIVVRVPSNPLRPLFEGLDTFNDYEIVFGHRRRRAAELAGLATVPAVLCTMSDEEVRRAQLVENMARDDVHAIEEAEGFDALMKQHGVSAEQLVEQTGKSRSYIYGRLKLLQAIPAVRDACLGGEFGSEVALLIARLRQPKLQERALAAIKAKSISLTDGGKRSYRQMRALLADMFTLELKGAIFDPEDAGLVPSAGACSACPKLSGNAPEFQDLAEPREGAWPGFPEKGNRNLCTDPGCWEGKHKAHLQRQAAELRAQGKTVVDGAKAKAALSSDGRSVKGAYVALKDVAAALKKAANAKLPGSGALALANKVLIQNQRTGAVVEAMPVSALKTYGVDAPGAASHAAGRSKPYDYEADRRERQQRIDRDFELVKAVHERMAQVPRNAFDLSFVLNWCLRERLSHPNATDMLASLWGHADGEALAEAVATMSVDEQGLLLMDCALMSGSWVYGHNEPDKAKAAAAYYGIPTPSTAAQANAGAAVDTDGDEAEADAECGAEVEP